MVRDLALETRVGEIDVLHWFPNNMTFNPNVYKFFQIYGDVDPKTNPFLRPWVKALHWFQV